MPALVTGIETVLADNPRLTVRHEEAGLTLPDGIDASWHRFHLAR